MISASARLARRLDAVRAEGDRGSLVLAMLVTLVATSVAALVLPLFLTSAGAARFDDRRTQQLAAAQSGVETALARIRAAVDSSSAGLISALPCATLTGVVLGRAGLRYQADVRYYAVDPGTLSAAQLVSEAIPCLTDVVGGVVRNLGTRTTPAFARITGKGTDATAGFPAGSTRTVSATYVVKTTNSNIVGGLFRVNKLATSKDLCLDAGGNPTAGTYVTMKRCNADSAAQKWAYNATLTVSLVATRVLNSAGAITSDGLCVDGGPLVAAKEVAGTQLQLQACGATTTLTQQRWSMNDYAGMQGTDDGAVLNSLCWAVQDPDQPGSRIVLGTRCAKDGGGYDNIVSWQPEAAVGAGASGAAYNELVNYKQFGRCLDVTNTKVDSKYLIAWPCKQQPDPTKVLWNQRWSLPATTDGVGTGRITTTLPGGAVYCLTSPGSAEPGQYVTVSPCPPSPTTETRWTVRTRVASYAASYQIEDKSGGAGAGLCLQVTDPTATPPDLAGEGTGISKIVVRPCTASTLQKWNAPPNIDAPSVKDQTEN